MNNTFNQDTPANKLVTTNIVNNIVKKIVSEITKKHPVVPDTNKIITDHLTDAFKANYFPIQLSDAGNKRIIKEISLCICEEIHELIENNWLNANDNNQIDLGSLSNLIKENFRRTLNCAVEKKLIMLRDTMKEYITSGKNEVLLVDGFFHQSENKYNLNIPETIKELCKKYYTTSTWNSTASNSQNDDTIWNKQTRYSDIFCLFNKSDPWSIGCQVLFLTCIVIIPFSRHTGSSLNLFSYNNFILPSAFYLGCLSILFFSLKFSLFLKTFHPKVGLFLLCVSIIGLATCLGALGGAIVASTIENPVKLKNFSYAGMGAILLLSISTIIIISILIAQFLKPADRIIVQDDGHNNPLSSTV